MPPLPVLVTMLVAGVTSFTRVFVASRPAWMWAPAWLQVLFPQLVLALGTLATGLAGGIKSWTDLTVVAVAAVMMILPGLPSNRSAAPLQANKLATGTPSAGDAQVALKMQQAGTIPPPPPPPHFPPSVPPSAAIGMLALCLLLGGCGLAAVAPYLAEAALVISDAINAVEAAQALLPSLHLSDSELTKAEALIAKARQALSAAAAADDGAKDLTSEQLDASLAAFRQAWSELQGAFAAKRIGAAEGSVALPVPLALRRVQK